MRSKLWIVDDEESIRTICKSALEENFKIETFSNGSEALLALNSEKPDLIITDIKMPGLTGIDLLKIVAEKYPDLPKLPNELYQSLEKLKNNKDINDAFGKEVINSYIKLKNSEINQFKQKENFDKTKAITRWERDNTLDC